MKFKINKREEKIIKTIRFPEKLVHNIERIAKKNNISFNKFIILACMYALDNMEDTKK